jgi:hypothetical protein
MKLTRRTFLQVAGATGATFTLADKAMAFRLLKPAVEVGNPLDAYPDRSWKACIGINIDTIVHLPILALQMILTPAELGHL